MKVSVTQQDIEDGRDKIGLTCGCPIWHALKRQLDLRQSADLRVEHTYQAFLGEIKIDLPRRAERWQLAGMKDKYSPKLKPFSFNARIKA